MTDRELLELAAKVAGVEINAVIGETFWRPDGITWNPLTDDSDALRLAVALDLHVQCDFREDGIVIIFGEWFGDGIEEPAGTDKYAAVRRAIVRAAAAIAQQEQPQ